MTFWQENYHFIKEVYELRRSKMVDWMDNVDKAISRILADKVYTSAEFKRERDNFHALCKDLERAEVKKWLHHILEILLAERAKDEKKDQLATLDEIIKRHEVLIPTVVKTQVKVDLYWKCYAYGDELNPHIEFLDGIMLSSTRDIAPSCVENVDELIERQEKSLMHLETRRQVVKELIVKGKQLLENPDKPKFLDNHVKRIEEGWVETKEKAQARLQLLQNTKSAWEGYAEGLVLIANEFEKAEEEIKKIKKRFNLQAASEDLEKRQKIFESTKMTIGDMFKAIQNNYDTMTMTLPDEKKDFVKKEMNGVKEKLSVIDHFDEKVKKIETFVNNLKDFDQSLKTMDLWMKDAENELLELKTKSGNMSPEDRISHSMELQEDISDKVNKIKAMVTLEENLLPQGDKVPNDAQDFKDELKRILTFVTMLGEKVKHQCDCFADDVKYWAEYKIGIKQFRPWLENAEKKSQIGLNKPQTLEEANALFKFVKEFEASCVKELTILTDAGIAGDKMTSHKDADAEVALLKARYEKVKCVADEWVKKVDILVKEWQLLDNTVTELNSWVAEDRGKDAEQQFSLEKMESTLGELKNIFKEKEKLVEHL